MSAAMRPAAPAAAARDVSVRAVEQGARLVAAPAGGHGAVLQMPRGNLETVCPRLLVLAAALGALGAGDYRAAWGLAVAQRLDLNLLVDYRWPAFLGDAAAFVEVGPARGAGPGFGGRCRPGQDG
jgi:elongator complex protein 1